MSTFFLWTGYIFWGLMGITGLLIVLSAWSTRVINRGENFKLFWEFLRWKRGKKEATNG
jgi:hypothetical protein